MFLYKTTGSRNEDRYPRECKDPQVLKPGLFKRETFTGPSSKLYCFVLSKKMNWNLFLFVFITGIAAPLAYPQDAELLPLDTPLKDSPTGGDDEGILIVNIQPSNPRRNSLPSLFNQIFRSSFLPNHFGPPLLSDGPSLFPDVPLFPDVSFDFPTIHDLFPSNIPNAGDLPDDYTNSTYDVTVVNGTRIETNMTVTKNRDQNGGVFVQEVHVIRYIPEDDGHRVNNASSSVETPLGNGENDSGKIETTTAAYEEFGVSTPFHVRTRRWAVPKFIRRYFSHSEPKPTLTPSPTTFRSYHGDTRVNYLTPIRNGLDEDAEIFDPKLLMNDRHHGLFSKPILSESSPESRPSPVPPKLSINNRPHISVHEEEYNSNRLLSGHGDTRVNYLTPMRNGLDEDAEIFDPKLMLNDMHHGLFSKPILPSRPSESRSSPVLPRLSANNRPHTSISVREGEYNSNGLLFRHGNNRFEKYSYFNSQNSHRRRGKL